MRKCIVSIILLLSVWATPVRAAYLPQRTGDPAQNNNCAMQVFDGAYLGYTINYGAPYLPVPPTIAAYMRTIYACPITQVTQVGAQQTLGFLSDGYGMVVRAGATDDTKMYIYRDFRVFPVSRQTWDVLVGLLMPRAPSNKGRW